MNQRTFANFFILSISIVEPSVPAENNLNSSARKSEHDTGLPAKWNRTMVWKTSLIHLKTYLHQIIIIELKHDMISSGGSRGGDGGGPPPLILRPNWGPKGRKKFFRWFWTGTHDLSQDESQDSPWLFVTKSLYFNVSNWGRDRHFTWSFEPSDGLAVCKANAVPSFLIYLRLWVLLQPRESNPRPPTLQSSALLTELFLPSSNKKLIAIIPTRIFCEMQANFSEIETSPWHLSYPMCNTKCSLLFYTCFRSLTV